MAEVKTIGSLELSRRLGVAQTTVWLWSRKGRLGEPVNPGALKLKWRDDEQLAFAVEAFKKRPRSALVWGYTKKNPGETVTKFAFDKLETDAEDREMAELLISLAVRRWERTRAGKQSPCSRAAERFGICMRGKRLADHAGIPEAVGTLVLRLSPEKSKDAPAAPGQENAGIEQPQNDQVQPA